MFAMMMMLAISSAIVEMMFAAKIPAWRRNAHKFKWLNMVISILLSFIMGVAFGAGGLIALGAAMISTALSIPGYAFLHWNYDSKLARRHPEGLLLYNFRKWCVALGDLFKLIYKIIRVLTAPIWITRAIIQKMNARKSRSVAAA